MQLHQIKKLFKEHKIAAYDIELILCQRLGLTRTQYHLNDEVSYHLSLAEIKALIEQKKYACPTEYITGLAQFWDYTFRVTPATLIPRPETEIIVEKTLEYSRRKNFATILDLGTGSGILAICLQKLFPAAQITAVDISPASLAVAADNAVRVLGAEHNIKFIESNWYAKLPYEVKYDLIVSNPPYISSREYNSLEPNVREYEPALALTDFGDGLSCYRQIIGGLRGYLAPQGWLMLEHGFEQKEEIVKLLVVNECKIVENVKDLSKHDRVIIAQHK